MYIRIIKTHEVIIKKPIFMDNYTISTFLLTEHTYKSIIFECVHTL